MPLSQPVPGASPPPILFTPFGTLPGGIKATLFTLINAVGSRMRVTDYGGIIVALEVPDRYGRLADVVLGFDTLAGYTSDVYREANPYFGAIIGRYGNRIAKGRFSLGRETVALAINDGSNHLHGGAFGFDRVMWEADPIQTDEGVGIAFRRTSPHGEEGYPGALAVTVTYTLTHEDRLVIDYEATSDATTVVNLTQHTYFNLTGNPSRDVLEHELTLFASAFTPTDSGLIPTGEIRPISSSPFDFSQPTPLGARIDADDEQIAHGQGYDHNFVIDRDRAAPDALIDTAQVYEPTTGRLLLVTTTEPGVQLYSGNHLDGRLRGKQGIPYARRSGFCLETQHYPDSPNQPHFPSTRLQPGDRYVSRTVYTFRSKSASPRRSR